jgi:large subunit ribosomal protein L22
MPDAPNQDVKAIARYVRVSPQKARLVVDLIRGRRAAEALELLRFTRKRIAGDVAKLLQSAIANATDRGELDVDALYVTRAFVNDGPRQKRIRPAPMGRAYRYQRRSSHIEVHVGERAAAAGLTRRVEPAAAAPAPAPAKKPAARKPAARKSASKKPAAARPASKKSGASGAKKPAARKPAARQPKGGE